MHQNFVINIIVKALSRDVRANGPLVGSSTKVSVGCGRKDPRGTTTFRHLKGMIYLEIRVCTHYEKIKVSTRKPEDLLFALQNFGARNVNFPRRLVDVSQ